MAQGLSLLLVRRPTQGLRVLPCRAWWWARGHLPLVGKELISFRHTLRNTIKQGPFDFRMRRRATDIK